MAKRGHGGTKYQSASFGPPPGTVTFDAIPPELLQQCCELVTAEGDCLMLSRTRDGGAIHIRILADGLVEKWYAGSDEELLSVFEGIRNALLDDGSK
jgi:hypothetical protein